MSNKKSNVSSVGSVGYGHAYVVYDDVTEVIVGHVMPMIEAAGLRESQEAALKGLIKEKIYGVFWDRNPIYIDSSLHAMLREKYWQLRQEADSQSVPLRALKLEDIK
jgi:hypothetical protein